MKLCSACSGDYEDPEMSAPAAGEDAEDADAESGPPSREESSAVQSADGETGGDRRRDLAGTV